MTVRPAVVNAGHRDHRHGPHRICHLSKGCLELGDPLEPVRIGPDQKQIPFDVYAEQIYPIKQAQVGLYPIENQTRKG